MMMMSLYYHCIALFYNIIIDYGDDANAAEIINIIIIYIYVLLYINIINKTT